VCPFRNKNRRKTEKPETQTEKTAEINKPTPGINNFVLSGFEILMVANKNGAFS